MQEKGYEIANNSVIRVFDLYSECRNYQYIEKLAMARDLCDDIEKRVEGFV
jgi:hypothetical protein